MSSPAVDTSSKFHTDVPKRFMARFNRYEPIVKDHSAIILYKECPRKYFHRIVLGRAEKDTPPYFVFGSAYHKFREVLEQEYFKHFVNGKPPIYKPEIGMLCLEPAINAANNYWKKHSAGEPPVGTKWDFMTYERLLKSCMVAYQWWENEKRQNNIVVVATEQPFCVEIGEGTGIFTGGRADQIVRWNGKLWGRDFKTSSKDQKYYSRGITPNDQFTRYTYAESKLSGQLVQGQIIEVLFNKKATKTEYTQNAIGPYIKTHIASRNKSELDRWVAESIFWDKLITQSREEDMYPMVEKSCIYCPYHSVCKQPSEGAQMAQLEQFFKLSPWDHTKVEQEEI